MLGLMRYDHFFSNFVLRLITKPKIYLYTQSQNLYVLSLPSFHWTHAGQLQDYGRGSLVCNIIGKRQLVVVGGTTFDTSGTPEPDPWPNGLGVYDLSELKWRSSYDPNAEAYVTPRVVRDYNKAHPKPKSWGSSGLKELFSTDGTRRCWL